MADDWWGGRPVRHLLQRLFFEHFSDTSFVAEESGRLLAFLIGFRSQAHPHVAYIHFVGVEPSARNTGLGRRLYMEFFAKALSLGCSQVQCITSPVNAGSIAFHRRLGFTVVPSSTELDGIPVAQDYAGPGQARVLFRLSLETKRGDA